MEESKFKIGDVVSLKISDMPMIIQNIHPPSTHVHEEDYSCLWFDGMSHLQCGMFGANVLRKR